MAPRTIFVLKREPGWCARCSDQSRNKLRVRMTTKTSSAATMNTVSAYRSHWRGSKGSVKEPSVITAESNRAIAKPPKPSNSCDLRPVLTLSSFGSCQCPVPRCGFWKEAKLPAAGNRADIPRSAALSFGTSSSLY